VYLTFNTYHKVSIQHSDRIISLRRFAMTDQEHQGKFNKDFYTIRNQDVVEHIQAAKGCFSCGTKRDDHKRCTACQFAKYCNIDCQKANWKEHKRICKEIQNQPVCNLPRLYHGLGHFDEEMLQMEMDVYSRLFLEEVDKSLLEGSKDMSLVVLCAEDAGKIVRLTARARFIDETFAIHNVDGVLFKTIDQGDNAIAEIYPVDGGHGSISDSKKALVVSYIEELVDNLHDRGISVKAMTCGRGLTWLAEDSDKVGEKLRTIWRMAG
jgi:hypothetical protein